MAITPLQALPGRSAEGLYSSLAMKRKEFDGGGLLEFQMPVPENRGMVERHLLRDTAYEALCDAIVDGTLAPGERLRDNELCQWLGLSRTPVRGALARLEDDGLVETVPQRFTRVLPLEPQRAHDLFPVLAVLHGLATELAVSRLRPADIQALNEANDEFIAALAATKPRAVYDADDRFHGVFVRVAGNEHVTGTLDRLAPQLHRLELHTASHLPGSRSIAQHQVIVSRAASGDAAGAATAVRANWMGVGARVDHALAAR